LEITESDLLEVSISSHHTNSTHPTEYLYIALDENLKKDSEYKLISEYTGYLKNDNFGFYIRYTEPSVFSIQ